MPLDPLQKANFRTHEHTAAQIIDSSTGSPIVVGGSAGSPADLTGATAATRYVGGTTSGAPVSGTFAVGDFVIDQTGKVWICTVAGSPGTWSQVSGGGGGGTPAENAASLVYAYNSFR